jgi:monofunctional biosynthetic peptidoglycan transglycosylase
MARAVILAEDGRFLEHGGVDWEALADEVRYDGEPPFSWLSPADLRALVRAARYYRSNRDGIRGRSTITQQLAKNLYFTPERSLTRKVGELVVAKRLEWFLSKDRILELYLNTVELGPGLFGVGAAARVYFGTSAADLSMGQAAALAGTLPHPLTSNPAYRPAQMAWRRDIIIGRMSRTAAVALPSPVEFSPPEPPVDVTPPAPDTAGGEPPPPPPL